MTIYTVTAFDADGNVIATSDGELTFDNAEFVREFLHAEYRPASVTISDALGYTY
jgi:hypothetical protein